MSKYLITLTPMGSYFFGGERSFTVGEDDKNELASYIVESNLFPQQTSLLGMLRFWLLRNSDAFDVIENKITDEEKAIELIGSKSFCIEGNNIQQKSSFGQIKSIGYCFLQKKEKENGYINILPSPLDYKLNIDFSKPLTAYYNGVEKKIPTITYKNNEGNKPYTAKDGLTRRYISESGVFEEKDIFIKDRRIGINRDIKTGRTDDNSLYKQVFYSLADGFRFAFVAEFSADFQLKDKYKQKQIVELGGDSSKFILEIVESFEESRYDNHLLEAPAGSYKKAALLSDSYIDNEVIAKSTMFSISEHIPFRFLTFDTSENTKYSRMAEDGKKSNRYSLFKRGSVFYFENKAQLENFEEGIKKGLFRQIGYNEYEFK